MQTGASLKLKILNPNASIWTLFAGGGGSLVMTDSLGALGYAHEIGNYGELSGNPTREFTREYVRVLVKEVLKAKPQTQKKYLIIAGAIANFTDIATTFQGVIDILEELQEEIRAQKIEILVRRGGINEKK
jgi:succinyl-CoA synthetase beta subunit